MQMARRSWWMVAALALATSWTTSSDVHARRKKANKKPPKSQAECDARSGKTKKNKLVFVDEGQALLGGPGLGFETVLRTDKAACFLSYAEKGDYVLVAYDKKNAAWVLKQAPAVAEDVEVVPLPDAHAKVAYTVRETSLHTAPSSTKVAKMLPAGAPLDVLGKSPDGDWWKVSANATEGWVRRFHLSVQPFEKGGETQVAKVADWTQGTGSFQDAKARTEAGERKVAGDDKAPDDKAPDDKAPDDKATDDKGDDTKGSAPAATADADLVAISSVNRQMELSVGGGFAYLAQDYRSDSQNDLFHAYSMQSPAMALRAGFAYRSGSPWVFTGDVFLGGGGVALPIIPGYSDEEALAFWVPNGFDLGVGARVHDNDAVDVEIGVRFRTLLVPWLGMPEALPGAVGDVGLANAFPTTLSFGAAPYVRTLSRLGGLGFVVLDGSIMAGTSLFFPDAGLTLLSAKDDLPPPITADEDPDEIVSPHPLQLAAQAQGTLRYMFPISDTFLVSASSTVWIMQTSTTGPGTRTGTYTFATQIDMNASVEVGVVVGF